MPIPINGNASFIKRTKDNLKTFEDMFSQNGNLSNFYEVTQLINCALGLIVFPYEAQNATIQTDQLLYNERAHKYGKIYLCRERTSPYLAEDDSIDNIIYHVRNAISHGHIDTNKDGTDIRELHFRDCYQSIENFYMIMPLDKFKEFALYVASTI